MNSLAGMDDSFGIRMDEKQRGMKDSLRENLFRLCFIQITQHEIQYQ